MLFCCLQRKVEVSGHTLCRGLPPSTNSAAYQRPVINWPQSVAAKFIALAVHSTQWSQILAQNHNLCRPHLHSTPSLGGGGTSEYCHAVWYGKQEWFGYPMVKQFWRYDYSFWQNSRTWRTDTAWRHRLRLHSIARQKLTL